jgi:hypothetical protein
VQIGATTIKATCSIVARMVKGANSCKNN